MRTRWPLLLIALPAFVAIWSGWVGLGRLTGFGPVVLLPGIADGWVIDSSITLPIGVEAYSAYALSVFLAPASSDVSDRARQFACWSSIGSLALGMAGQVAYHLMTAAGMRVAPWQITAFVACLPVLVLGCAAALVHLTHHAGGTSPAAPPDGRDRTYQPLDEAGSDSIDVEAAELFEAAKADRAAAGGVESARADEEADEDETPDRRAVVDVSSNAAIIADLRALNGRTGRRYSRDDVKAMYGVGSGRAEKLLTYIGWFPRVVPGGARAEVAAR